jgi:hypothetical protein
MRSASWVSWVWGGLAAAALALGAGLLGGCGSSEDEDEAQGASSALRIYFPKLYSAHIEGGRRPFKVPAVVAGLQPDRWECSDEDAVRFEKDGPNGVIITTLKAGTFDIIARAGKEWGKATLEVTAASQAQLDMGEQRYDNGVEIGVESFALPTSGSNAAPLNPSCKNCHGKDATFLKVVHTSRQIGGYSDAELIRIISTGIKPDGAKFSTSPSTTSYFSVFHRWAASEAEYQGLVVYLRSLPPDQQGELDIMGLISEFRARSAGTAGRSATAGTSGAAAGGGAGSAVVAPAGGAAGNREAEPTTAGAPAQ